MRGREGEERIGVEGKGRSEGKGVPTIFRTPICGFLVIFIAVVLWSELTGTVAAFAFTMAKGQATFFTHLTSCILALWF